MPVQHAAAIDNPCVQVAGQQQVELLQKQRNGQADPEEAEGAAVEEEGPHASRLHRELALSQTERSALLAGQVWGDSERR